MRLGVDLTRFYELGYHIFYLLSEIWFILSLKKVDLPNRG